MTEPRPVEPSAQELRLLPVDALLAEIPRLQNSNHHLERSNQDMRQYDPTNSDADLTLAIQENTNLVERQKQRIQVIRGIIHERLGAEADDAIERTIQMTRYRQQSQDQEADPMNGSVEHPAVEEDQDTSNNSNGVFLLLSNQSATDSFENLLGDVGKKSVSGPETLDAMRARSATPQTGTSERSVPGDSQWDFDLLSGKPNAPTRASPVNNVDDLLEYTGTPSVVFPQPLAPSQTADDDDILGELGKPIQEARASPQSLAINSPSPKAPRADSEKDALVARIVEMGFTAEQALNALSATSNGRDVDAAIDFLVSYARVSAPPSKPAKPTRQFSHTKLRHTQTVERERDRLMRKNRHGESSQAGMSTQRQQQSEQTSSGGSNFQDRKEHLVAQASEIRGYLYQNAGILFNKGRDKLGKVIDEFQTDPTERERRAAGRPKWMQGDLSVDVHPQTAYANIGQYADSSDDEKSAAAFWDEDAPPKRKERPPTLFAPSADTATRQSRSHVLQKQGGDEPYVSPSRRAVQKQAGHETYISPSRRALETPSTHKTASPKPVAQPPKPTPAPTKIRHSVPATSSQVNSANALKTQGNEAFKLGQFDRAERFYTQAMDNLPARHDDLIPLFNNRAASRLKTGDHRGCVYDCDEALSIIGEFESQFKHQVTKAYLRKAQAYESLEKYKDAEAAYAKIISLGGQNRSVNEGLTRCRKAMNPVTSNKAPPKPSNSGDLLGSPKTTSNPFKPNFVGNTPSKSTISSNSTSNSKRVQEMRAQAAAQDKEEEQRLQLNDKVETKLAAWKTGKQGNLRALLVGLDSVLWREAQWTSVTMAQLIDPKRCKIIYMKAIAKVHPDKLGPGTMVEHKMLANGVFGTLNEAWDEFKQVEVAHAEESRKRSLKLDEAAKGTPSDVLGVGGQRSALFLQLLIALVCLAALAASAQARTRHAAIRPNHNLPLKHFAPHAPMIGAAINPTSDADKAVNYALVGRKDYNFFVAENECKFTTTESSRNHFDFSQCDAVHYFARSVGAKFRGHNLVWGVYS
ncbi:hypothetical protein BZG36_05338 [Bifiguratus adelaidae]|uniref:UBA domain-containing protein n=1 Tax=Bifiguratus adelaidae TaxID=1938954 RepID=A0A261XU21_9FUNG|nr:hypothetical protein BZG36_05338 [Bifiguratus adelaidae]